MSRGESDLTKVSSLVQNSCNVISLDILFASSCLLLASFMLFDLQVIVWGLKFGECDECINQFKLCYLGVLI